MPTVPTTERQIPRGTTPSRGISVNVPDVTPQSPGVALKIVQDEVNKSNQIATLDADDQLSRFKTDLLNNPDTGVLNTRGKDALGIYEPTMEAYDKEVGRIASGLGNRSQRLAFQNLSVSRRASLDKQLQVHGSAQQKQYYNEVAKSWLSNGMMDVAENYEDMEGVANHIQEATAVLKDYGKRNGKSSEAIKESVRKHTSDIHKAVLSQMIARGDDLAARDYFKENDKDIVNDTEIRSKVTSSSTEGEAARIAEEVWATLGPETDIDPVEQDKMSQAVRDATDDEGMRKTAITNLMQRGNLHNSSAMERTNANLSAVYGDYSDGVPVSQIYTSEAFVALSGKDRASFKSSIARAEKEAGRSDKDAQRIEQTIRFEELSDNLDVLRSTDLEAEVREGAITSTQYSSLKKLLDPKAHPLSKTAITLVNNYRTQDIFNSEDKKDNENQWATATEALNNYMLENPDENPLEWVKEFLKPAEEKRVGGIIDRLFGLTPEKTSDPVFQEVLVLLGRTEDDFNQEQYYEKIYEPVIATLEAEGKPVTSQSIASAIKRRKLTGGETTITNPTTGETLILEDGKWQKL